MSNNATRTEHILVVDDDARIRQMLTRYFQDEGYRVSATADGPAMRDCLGKAAVDIILLDLVLPGGEDGLALARDIRSRSNIPIIMLTGRDDVIDRIVGLEVGADDYIAKPFHLREVLARVRSVLRRHQAPVVKSGDETTEKLCFDGWQLNVCRRQLSAADGSDVALTTGEFDMLCVLVKHAGRVLTRELLMDLTRSRNMAAYDRTIDAQVARLRKKIENDPKNPTLIKSVRNVGYVFSVKPTQE